MLLRHVMVLSLSATLALTACERRKPADVPEAGKAAATTPTIAALSARAFRVELQASGCADRCTGFKAEWLDFPAQPALNAALLALAEAPSGFTAEESLRRLGKSFLADAAENGERWEQVLSAELEDGLNDVTLIETENYTFTGGAHGMTAVTFVNWDRRLGRVLTLQDVLLPGQDQAFWLEAQRAHQAWVRSHEDSASLGAGWPFDKTGNFALKPDGLLLKYQPYAIGPYSEGTPEIRIPYERLGTVLKPAYLPAR